MGKEPSTNIMRLPAGKITPPRADPECYLYRPRLLGRLQNAASRARAVLLEGQAGQGKTIAAAQLLVQLQAPAVWYRLDGQDEEPATLVSSLAHLLAEHIEGAVPAPTAGHLGPAEIQAAADQLLAQLAARQVATPLFVVFDDLDAAEACASVLELIAYFVRNAPQGVKFLLIGRSIPAAISALPTEASVWIRNLELAFTEEEIRLLYQQVMKLRYPRRFAATVHRLTAGWTFGVVQFVEGMRTAGAYYAGAPLEQWPPLHVAHEAVHAFFRQQVIARLSPEEQSLLAALAWLDPVDPIQAAAALQSDTVERQLHKFRNRNLFLHAVSGDATRYTLHPLFRTFLQQESHALLGAGVAREILGRAARWARQHGRAETALRQALRAGELTLADDLIRQDHTLLLTAVHDLGVSQEDAEAIAGRGCEHPWLALLVGTALMELDPARALPLMAQIQEQFREDAEPAGELAAMAQQIIGQGVANGCLTTIAQLQARVQDLLHLKKEPLSAALDLLITLALASSSMFLGAGTREANDYADRALALAQQLGLSNHEVKLRLVRGFAYILLGDFPKASVEVEHLFAYLQEPNLSDLNRLLIRAISCNLLNCYGADESFSRHAGKLVRDDRRGLFRRTLVGPLIFRWRADRALARGDITSMLQYAEAGLALGFCAFSPHLRAQLLQYRAYAHAARGARTEAMADAAEADRLRAEAGGEHYRLHTHIMLGMTFAQLKAWTQADEHLSAAVAAAPQINAPYPLAGAYLHRCHLRLQSGREADAIEDCRAFLSVMREHEFSSCFAWSPQAAHPLLQLAIQREIDPATARALAEQRLGVYFDKHGVPHPLLRLQTLGGFEVWQGDVRLAGSKELTPRPQQYVATLAAAPGCELSREALQEAMWPDGGQSASKLYALRNRIKNVIVAQRPEVDIEAYFVLRGSLARLEHVEIDARTFFDQVRRGLQFWRNNQFWQADNAFYEAHLLWHGSYFPTAPDTDYIRDFRAELDRLDHQRVTLWSEILIRMGAYNEASDVLAAHFEADPTSTEVAARLHTLHFLRGDPVGAAKLLRRHQDALEQEGYPAEEIDCVLEEISAGLNAPEYTPVRGA
jgi:ATP/maltotriose-dependent transcriptional regulator MalT/DNA-binding SARP family transcriptional activator